jgi:hypothetical protein
MRKKRVRSLEQRISQRQSKYEDALRVVAKSNINRSEWRQDGVVESAHGQTQL